MEQLFSNKSKGTGHALAPENYHLYSAVAVVPHVCLPQLCVTGTYPPMTPTNLKLDRIDLKILSELQKSGRITNVELAELVGLSPSPCLTRVKRLEQSGYITGYGAHINLHKLGEFITVFTEVTLQDHRANDFARFETKTRNIDEIIECHLVSGGYDYLLKFVTPSVATYQAIIENMLEGDYGIEKYFSYIVIKSRFVKHHYPLQRLFGEKKG